MRAIHSKKKRGFLMIEIIVTVSIVLITVASIVTLYSFIFNSENREHNKLQAGLYAQEALEAVDFAARFDWNQMQNGTYHPEIVAGVWKLMAGSELLENRFTRSIVISPTMRSQSSNGHAFSDIVASGGSNDPETKLVTATISWNQVGLGAQSLSYQMYQARDASYIFNQQDWSGGGGQSDWSIPNKFSTASNVDVSAPGVIALAANFITWDNASVTAEYDLPGNIDADALFVLGDVLYIGTLNNSPASDHELYAFDISNLSIPVLLDSFEIGADVHGIYANGSYMAIATSDNSRELQIFNIADPANLQRLLTIDLPGNDDAYDIDAAAGVLHIIQGATLYTFNYSNPAAPVQTDSLTIGSGVLNALSIKGSKVYIASSISNRELVVVDASDPANLLQTGLYDLPGNRQATDVYAFGLYAYVVTSNDGSSPEFYMFGITGSGNPTLAGTYEVGEKVSTVSALSNFAFIGSNLLGDDILVLDITNPAAITLDTGYNVKGTAADVFPTPEAIYLATTSNDSELIIISVNSNVDLYSPLGVLESSTFDTQSPTSTYNWMRWSGETPSNTSVKFQFASNNDKTTWNYTGPDGTASTFYTSLNARMLINYAAHLNNRYVRYKAQLESTNKEQTPIVNSVEFSYSP